MQTNSISQEALEMAYAVRDRFPGLTGPEIAVELLRIGLEDEKRETERARTQAVEMLLTLSPEALEYVLKPIEWAYNWTDGNDPDSMTKDDFIRFSLIGCAIRKPADHVTHFYKWHLAILRNEFKRSRKVRGGRPIMEEDEDAYTR